MSNEIEKVETPWTGLIAVCAKCGRKLGSEDISNDLKKELKSLAKGSGQSIRVVTSSCLDICPDDRIAISYTSSGETRSVTVEEGTDPTRILESLIK